MEFSYKGKNKQNQNLSGKITANNEKAASDMLSSQEIFVLEIKPLDNGSLTKMTIFKKKISLKDKIIFTKELAIMVKGGLPLIDALNSLEEQAENIEFKKVLEKVTEDVRGGMALSKSFSKHPEVFSELYIAVTISGERSGKLDVTLERLADQLQKDYDLITEVKSAITYPIVIVCALIGVVILMLVFVIPKMKTIFDEMGAVLPLPTRVLLGISAFAVNYWYIVIIILVGIVLLTKFWAKTAKGGLFLDKMKVKVPIFGTLVRKIYLARFTRTTATLVSSGLPMLEIIETIKTVVGNKYYLPSFNQISKDVESGIPLSGAMMKHKIFPIMVAQMISVGEKTGKIDEILIQLATFYDKEVEASTSSLASLIEPILIIVIGIGMGLAIIAVIMPIYSLVNVI